jgi:hypothetical protein
MAIISAPPGYKLVRAFVIRGEAGKIDADFSTTEVIGFRVGDPDDCPNPVTVMGEPKPTDRWLLVHPDGRCSASGDGYSDIEEWKKDTGLEG